VFVFRSLPPRLKTISLSFPLSPSVSGSSYPDHLVYSAAKYAPFPPAMTSFTIRI
jgi:hypothetical protein